MPLSATSNSAFTAASDTFQTQAKLIKFVAKGLRASTRYQLFVEDIDYGWAARQTGKNLGEDLISDDTGTLEFSILIEIPYTNAYGVMEGISSSPAGTNFQNQTTKNNYRQSIKNMELRAPNSSLFFPIPATYYFLPDKPNRIDEGL